MGMFTEREDEGNVDLDIKRMENVAQKIQDAVDMHAGILKGHEAFLQDWLERFGEIMKNEVQAVEPPHEGRLEERR